jgi:hypothetical protein
MTKNSKINFPQHIKIAPNSLTLFTPKSIFIDDSRNFRARKDDYSVNSSDAAKVVRSNQHNGFISFKAAARLQTKIKYLFWLSKCFTIKRNALVCVPNNKISFVTLTLSAYQLHSDSYIKRFMIGQFCIELSNRYPGLLYIWRAEKQNNGNIHFHFMLNKFIQWQVIRKIWNRIQKKEGYLSRYQAKFSKMWFEEYCTNITNFKIDKLPQYRIAYNKGVASGWCDPNSIDVVNIKSIKNIYAYISKYMCKDNIKRNDMSEEERDNLKIEGRIYYCCTAISNINSNSLPIDEHISMDLDKIHLARPDSIHYSDYFTCIRLSIEQIFNLGAFHIYHLFIIHTNTILSCPTKNSSRISENISSPKLQLVTRFPKKVQMQIPYWIS